MKLAGERNIRAETKRKAKKEESMKA